ncbi:2314_t:CDS:2 [Rhizophagus irregularis]|nr:2314_t:CDS:2 [Rhizophagus irregularis]
MSEYSEVFQPFIDLFTQSQVNTVLLAWLPAKFGPYMSGIMTVDMFLTSVIASGISTFALAMYKFISSRTLNDPIRNENTVTVQLEYYYEGIYGDLSASIFYEALSWLISNQTKQLDKGAFIVRHTNSVNNNDDDECAPPNFNILPEKNQQITIEYKGLKFDVAFKSSTSIDIITDYLNEITRSYLETQRKMKVRSRYERNSSYWYHVQTLSCVRNLDSVALDELQEILLKRELDTFVNDKDFYDRIGIPYRRGILLYGKPGTGKTSLINAISSHLSRDTYYLNLKTISDDNELSAAFSSVPANQIIVLEDVDTQSKVLHKRTKKSSSFFSTIESLSIDKKDNTGPSGLNGPMGPSLFSKFSLSTFLGCLDGNILAEGNIIIMTTNHVEHLDPACIRPGRMDVHLDLGYCTHYQIRKMYKTISENPKAEFPKDILEKIPERLLPPCEVMMTMVLYRNDIHLIPEKIYELILKYKDMSPEEIARQMEEEALREAQRISEESEENKEEVNGEVKDENKDEKDEAKDENEEKKEEVKDENQEKKEEAKDEVKDENKNEKDEVKDDKEKKEEVKVENQEKKEEVKGEVKVENKDRKENVKDENKEKKENIEDENKEKKEEVREEFKGDNKDEKEEGKDENKKKEDIKEDVKDENKDNEEKIKNENESKNNIEIEKTEEEIIKKEIEKERIIKCEVINKEE